MKQVLGIVIATFCISQSVKGQAYGNAYDNRIIQANSRHNEYYYDKPLTNFEADAQAPRKGDINLEINVLSNVRPDSYVAFFNITQVGETASGTDSLAGLRIESFKRSLLKLGIPEENILTDIISFIPVYEVQVEKKLFSKSYNEVPKGFELQKNVHVKFKDINILDQLIAAASVNEIYDFIKLDYFIKNTEEVWNDIMTKSIAFLEKKKAHYKKLGIDLDSMKVAISEDTKVAFPVDRYKSYTAFNQTSIDAIKKKHEVTESKKQVTKYYSKLPYHKYDAIIHPEILEPALQFTYSLKLAYYETPKSKPQVVEKEVKKHFFISESGNAKVIPLD